MPGTVLSTYSSQKDDVSGSGYVEFEMTSRYMDGHITYNRNCASGAGV